jgi:hypothetical protein
MVDADGKPIFGEVPDKEILAHLDRHSKAVMKDFYRTSEFCSACHKAALPRQLNDYKWQRAIFLYDEWQLSSFAKQSPLPFYVKDQVSKCQTCHMKPEEMQLPDYGAKDGKLASHRWLGANTVIPKYYNYDEQMEKTIAFLRNNVLNVDIFGVERNEGQIIAPLGSQSFDIAPGDDLTASVVIQNKGIAHSLVPEQRDFYESWVEFEATDAKGNTLMHSGALQPGGALDPQAHSFTNRLVNVRGGLNDLHQVWDTRVVAYNNTIQSGRSWGRLQSPLRSTIAASTSTSLTSAWANTMRCRWWRWPAARALFSLAPTLLRLPRQTITRIGCAGTTMALPRSTHCSTP